MTPPSQAPGLLSTGTESAHECSISIARSSISATLTPIKAPGTSPKYESAE